jgi:hypothetical protein
MKLKDNWRMVLSKAWSVRFIALAGLFSGVETALPSLSDSLPPHTFAALTAIATAGAFISRLIIQKDV